MIRGADISIAQLRALVAVAEEGAYTRAAARLGVSQPGVSHALSALEKHTGGPLFSKGENGMALTALGETVLASARKVLNELQVLGQQVASFHQRSQQQLTIGAIPSALRGWLSPMIARFSNRYPEAISLVLEGMEEEIKEWVESGVVDVGITTDITQLNMDYWREHFEWTLLKRDEIVAVVPARHPLGLQASVTLAELARYPLVMSSGGCEALIQQLFANTQEEPFTVDVWVRDTQSLLQMVAAEVGVSLIPRLGLNNRPVEGVEVRPLSPVRHRHLIAFWPKKQPLNSVGQQWLDELVQPRGNPHGMGGRRVTS